MRQRMCTVLALLLLIVAVRFDALAVRGQPPRVLVLDHARVIDGTGEAAEDDVRLTIRDDRIQSVGPGGKGDVPDGAVRLDLAGRTVMPGLIDLHFHVEKDPKLALRQLANGVTSFRDPGQWIEQYESLRALIAAEQPAGAADGPHRAAHRRRAVPRTQRIRTSRAIPRRRAVRRSGTSPTAPPPSRSISGCRWRARGRSSTVCRAHEVPCTAHLEILDAREVLRAGLDGIEHITSFGTSVVPRRRAEQYRQEVLRDNDARRDGRYALFAGAALDAPDASALYEVLRSRRPFVNPTLAVFEVRPERKRAQAHIAAEIDLRGFAAMKRLTLEAFRHGARITLGGHSDVPFADRGEAPWRELELLVESGLTPLAGAGGGDVDWCRHHCTDR